MNMQQKKQSAAPTFTPPTGAPTFTPPTGQINGAVCYHHPDEPAAAQCTRCGRYICRDCAEAYGVTAGRYAGKSLCYDCCEQLVQENIDELNANKAVISKQYKLTRIGVVAGFIFGLIVGLSAIASGEIGILSGLFLGIIYGAMFALVGGTFLTALKVYWTCIWEGIKTGFTHGWVVGVISACLACFVGIFQCMWRTIQKLRYYSKYLKETEGFIEADTAALQQMRDYMEYTQVRSNNRGIDLDALMTEGSALYDNSYAQAMRDRGEAAADAMLRQATTTITENGEIIRSFAA